MKLDTINLGLRAAAACALILAGCDPDGDSDATGAGTETDGAGTTTGGDDDDDADGGSTTEDGPMGMGVDPPTFECEGADQTLVDAFFIIEDGENNEVDKLDGVSVIDGSIDINRTNYNNLDFLNCVTEITGTITIFGNDFLVDVSALNNLEVLGGDFIFTSNNAITVFDGMEQIDQVFRSPNPACEDEPCGGVNQPPIEFLHSVVMNKNEVLESVEGWDSLEFIFGNITIRDNPNLKTIDGFKGLIGVGLNLAIAHNPALCQSSVNCVGGGISNAPMMETWIAEPNDNGC